MSAQCQRACKDVSWKTFLEQKSWWHMPLNVCLQVSSNHVGTKLFDISIGLEVHSCSTLLGPWWDAILNSPRNDEVSKDCSEQGRNNNPPLLVFNAFHKSISIHWDQDRPNLEIAPDNSQADSHKAYAWGVDQSCLYAICLDKLYRMFASHACWQSDNTCILSPAGICFVQHCVLSDTVWSCDFHKAVQFPQMSGRVISTKLYVLCKCLFTVHQLPASRRTTVLHTIGTIWCVACRCQGDESTVHLANDPHFTAELSLQKTLADGLVLTPGLVYSRSSGHSVASLCLRAEWQYWRNCM